MTNDQSAMRELTSEELAEVSGGVCQCGSGAKCVTTAPNGVQYTCGGMPLYGGTPVPN